METHNVCGNAGLLWLVCATPRAELLQNEFAGGGDYACLQGLYHDLNLECQSH